MRIERQCSPMTGQGMMYEVPKSQKWWQYVLSDACGTPPSLAERIKLMSDIEKTTIKCQVFLSNFWRK